MPATKTRESVARSLDSGAKVKIIDETSLTCTCDHQPWACQACDFEGWVGQGGQGGQGAAAEQVLSEREAVIRKRFKKTQAEEQGRLQEQEERLENEEDLKTSNFDPKNGWLERDPETTQTFKRSIQVELFTFFRCRCHCLSVFSK